MKGLATALLCIALFHVGATAAGLELSLGAGPSALSLDTVNDAIELYNRLILELNDTFAVHPDVTGSVNPVPLLRAGLQLHAAERYYLTDWLALSGHIGHSHASTATSGFYVGAEASEITVDLAFQAVSGVLGLEATFLDVGVRLAAFGGIGYYYALLDRRTVFEIPVEYPQVIAGVPPEGEGRYSGSTIGFEAGLSVTYPVARWFILGTRLTYRSARIPQLTDAGGTPLDLDGDDTAEPIRMSGLTVLLAVSIHIDLSSDERKE